jgi:hypothetical protein
MNVYDEVELNRIKKTSETNDKMEDFFNDKRKEWNDSVMPLFKVLSINLNNNDASKSILEAQSISLSFRQEINEQISVFLSKRSREDIKIKKIRQDKFIFYATGFGIKTNLGEKTLLIDAHLAENERGIQLIENHIQFLRDTLKNLETFGFSIKNMIELLNYLNAK